jgi:hypothetical protein
MFSLNSFIINSILFSSYVCINYNIGKYLISISSWDFIMSGDVPIMSSIVVLTALPFMILIDHDIPKPIDTIDIVKPVDPYKIDWKYLAYHPRYSLILQNKCNQLK